MYSAAVLNASSRSVCACVVYLRLSSPSGSAVCSPDCYCSCPIIQTQRLVKVEISMGLGAAAAVDSMLDPF